jgi:hypothetical protein
LGEQDRINEVAKLNGATHERSRSMPEEFKPRFDGTINLGHLMSLGGILLIAISGYYSFSSRLSVVEGQLTRIATVLENSIRQDEQIKSLTYRMDKVENARPR